MLQIGRSLVRSPAGVSGFFIDIKSFRAHYGPGFDSASNRNEYQGHFLGVKAAGAKADNLPPSCAVVTKSGDFNFLEPSGPLRACNGTAFYCGEYTDTICDLLLLHNVINIHNHNNLRSHHLLTGFKYHKPSHLLLVFAKAYTKANF